ncbi:hypothetical protein U27_03855 [Candidatus Vecturithrix granuli]|uniref:Uncharacterized protein n=1 Tax=Vecturithrix granuli TaxID=1499967 RepID=A0A081BX36_VECG1|nr:hypothetical protein U27_03855 [Candidatus Vecturithrix granuli]
MLAWGFLLFVTMGHGADAKNTTRLCESLPAWNGLELTWRVSLLIRVYGFPHDPCRDPGHVPISVNAPQLVLTKFLKILELERIYPPHLAFRHTFAV